MQDTLTNEHEEQREAVNHLSALRGDMPYKLHGVPVRRMSLESLALLSQVGSPYAAAVNARLNGRTPAPVEAGAHDLLLLCWIHAAAPDAVLEVCCSCVPRYAAPAHRAACEWSRTLPTDFSLAEVAAYITSELTAIGAAAHEAKSPYPAKKNGMSAAPSPGSPSCREHSAAATA